MKKLTLAMLLALIGATAMAQNFEGKTLEERIAFSTGDNEDTIKTAKGYLTMFQQTNANPKATSPCSSRQMRTRTIRTCT